MKRSPLKKKSGTEVKKVIQKLTQKSHDYIRQRDSINEYEIAGYCFDCGNYAEGRHFQAGHFIPDSVGGALLRYHPHNMHGQSSGCNMKVVQERVKINYTLKMQAKYGNDYVEHLLQMKQRTVKADIIFYTRLLELYEEGDEDKIVDFLENCR